jgi:serpin B
MPFFNGCKTQKKTDQASVSTDQTVSHDEAMKMLHEVNSFSFDFFRSISSQHSSENIAFSPASLNLVMGVVYSGARGKTRSEMNETFGFPSPENVFHPLYNAWFTELQNMAEDTLVEFSMANRVFVEESYPVSAAYKEDVQKWLGGAFESANFAHDPQKAEKSINHWVEEITRNRIMGLIPQGALTQFTRLVLVNALYIKSSWKYPFEKSKTSEKDFTAIGGEIVPATYMIQQRKGIPFYQGDMFTAIELPYTTPDLSLILIRPNNKNLDYIGNYIPDTTIYKNILDGLTPNEVEMEIPRFKVESKFTLSQNLKDAGLNTAFSNQADFSGISSLNDLSISSVFQKVFFEIDEKGSEAAAATGAVIVTTSMPVNPPEPKQFIADRPFLFILKENRYHTPLFVGQYVK